MSYSFECSSTKSNSHDLQIMGGWKNNLYKFLTCTWCWWSKESLINVSESLYHHSWIFPAPHFHRVSFSLIFSRCNVSGQYNPSTPTITLWGPSPVPCSPLRSALWCYCVCLLEEPILGPFSLCTSFPPLLLPPDSILLFFLLIFVLSWIITMEMIKMSVRIKWKNSRQPVDPGRMRNGEICLELQLWILGIFLCSCLGIGRSSNFTP